MVGWGGVGDGVSALLVLACGMGICCLFVQLSAGSPTFHSLCSHRTTMVLDGFQALQIHLSKPKFHELMRELDPDKDGHVDFEEFCKFMDTGATRSERKGRTAQRPAKKRSSKRWSLRLPWAKDNAVLPAEDPPEVSLERKEAFEGEASSTTVEPFSEQP